MRSNPSQNEPAEPDVENEPDVEEDVQNETDEKKTREIGPKRSR